jgi:hypothetical protein
MPRQKLLAIAALIVALSAAACSDLTGPSNDTVCPIGSGSDTCGH